MTPADTTSGERVRVRVYALANPAEVKQEEAAIERIVFGLLCVSDRQRYRLHVSDTSAWIAFTDTQQLWGRAAPNLPDDKEAKKTAEAFLEALATRLSGFNEQLPERLRRIALQPRLQPVELVKVAHPNAGFFDHWLYRCQPMLVLDRAMWRQVPVFGSQVEVRIGDSGRIVGYCSRWRPLGADRIHRDLARVQQHADEGQGHHDHHDRHDHHARRAHQAAEDAVPVYVLDGDRIPQYYLAPYYLVKGGHGMTLRSACDYALTVDIGQAEGPQGTQLTAIVDGGSGDYAFHWGVYAFDKVLDEGMRELGAGTLRTSRTATGSVVASTVLVPPGAYVALVNVKDRKTGAFKHHQQQIFSSRSGAGSHAAGDFPT